MRTYRMLLLSLLVAALCAGQNIPQCDGMGQSCPACGGSDLVCCFDNGTDGQATPTCDCMNPSYPCPSSKMCSGGCCVPNVEPVPCSLSAQ